MEREAYIGVGSNLGDKLHNCRKAISLIEKTTGCEVRGRSGFFRTVPVGVEGQDWYVNAAVAIITGSTPRDLMESLLAIEMGMGRVRQKKWDSRVIDLDILLFGAEVIREEGLQIPHPLMHMRRFVLVPMVQLAPFLIHPVLGKSLTELLDLCPVKGQSVVPLAER